VIGLREQQSRNLLGRVPALGRDRSPDEVPLAYDARYITAEPSGIGQMCLEVLHGLAELPDAPRIQVLVNEQTNLPAELLDLEHFQLCLAPWNPHGLRNQLLLPRLLKRQGIRLLHSADCFSPLAVRGVVQVVNVHDLIPLTCRDSRARGLKARFPLAWKGWLRLQCFRARMVVTVSRHSAADLSAYLGISQDKIRVIYNPVREWRHWVRPARLREQFGLRGRVVSCVGRQEPHKNLVSLVRAMRIVGQQIPDEDIKLVIAGSPDERYPEAQQEAVRLGLSERVLFTGYLDDARLGALYQTSDVFVFPSLYEGFGLPPLEAMRFGTPVVAGIRTAPPEVLGNAALAVDTRDPRAIAEGILDVLTNRVLAARLRQAGPRQAARYSRHRAAEQYRQLYQELMCARLGQLMTAR
jgi:glycosyltransferase involved in cell wall biosynthesis